jgi:hypothetical protein
VKIYVPDRCTPYRLASLGAGYATGGAASVLIDIGLRGAADGVTISDYIRFIVRVKNSVEAEEYYVVVPDVYGDAEGTHRNWLKYAPRLRPYGGLVYVAHEFLLPRDWGPVEPALIALPARSQNGWKCSLEPMYCANNIRKFLDVHRGLRIHLLGPARRVLLLLRRWDYLQYVESLDTTAPHMAPTEAAREMLGGGKWQATKSVRCVWLQEWLRGIL